MASVAGAPRDPSDKDLIKLADFLLSRVPGRDGVLTTHGGQRVRQFRGKKLVDFMLDPTTKRKFGLEHVKTENQATALANRLLNHQPPLFIPVERLKDKVAGHHMLRPVDLKAHPSARSFNRDEDGRYAWVYEGNATWNKLKLAGLVVAVIAACCYPLWPMVARTIVWYLSVTLLLALLGVTLLQFVVFGIFWVFGIDFWILPHLWSDDVSIIDAFKPLYTWDRKPGNLYYRAGGLAVLAAVVTWVGMQPVDSLAAMAAGQTDFVRELYAGTLLESSNANAAARTGGGSGGYGSGPGFFGQQRYGAAAYGGGKPVAVPKLDELEKETAEGAEAGEGTEAASERLADAAVAADAADDAASAAADAAAAAGAAAETGAASTTASVDAAGHAST